jgi:hypothetical protein
MKTLTAVAVCLLAALLLLSCPDGDALLGSGADPACSDNTGNRFVDCANGTVTDTQTGLIWLKDANCFGLQDWDTAVASAAGLSDGQCGLTDNSSAGDWRLPRLRCPSGWWCEPADATDEFASILAPPCRPCIPDTAGNDCWSEGDPFSGVRWDGYWSSTTHASNPDNVWIAYLVDGVVSAQDKRVAWEVWPVR